MGKPVKHYGKWRIRWKDSEGKRRSEVHDTHKEAEHALRRHEVEAEEIRRGIRVAVVQDRTFEQLAEYGGPGAPASRRLTVPVDARPVSRYTMTCREIGGNMITYLRVPFAEKDDAKGLGARWDPTFKRWYVPSGGNLAAFRRWLSREARELVGLAEPGQPAGAACPEFDEVGPYDGWEPGPLLVEFARRLGRDPCALLLRHACWSCGLDAYAVEVRLECGYDEEVLLDYPWGPLCQGTLAGQCAFELGGGAVAAVPGLQRALAGFELENAEFAGRIAAFKERFSNTVGGAYMSQGCPACDALWGDYHLSELRIRYIHRLADGDLDGVDLVDAFDLDVGERPKRSAEVVRRGT